MCFNERTDSSKDDYFVKVVFRSYVWTSTRSSLQLVRIQKTIEIYLVVESVKLLLVFSFENGKINNYTYGSQVYRTRLKWT